MTLTNVVVVDNQPAPNTPVFTRASLAPGEVASFSGSYPTYLAPTNCSLTDTLTATATSRCGVGVTDSATATCTILTTPGILVTAVCPATPVVPGGSLTYSGTVRNTGDIPLANVVVVSDRPAPNTTVFIALTLAPGEVANFSGTYPVPTNACAVTTTFRGTGLDLCTTTTVTNSVTTTCTVATAPAMAVTLICPVVPAVPGGSITYSGTVRNAGDVTLNNVFVVNNQPSNNTPVIGPLTLAPGATVPFTSTFTAPANACSASSTVTARGSDACTAIAITNSASATCTLLTTPALVVTQVCPVSPAVPGGLLTYSGTVSNAGDTTLTNVVVLNNLSGATPIFTIATLAPGALGSFTGSYVAPTNCTSTSTSTATGRSICGLAVTNTVSATCTILTTPRITVTAVCPVAPLVPGGSVIASGTVQNTGNIPLTNVVVSSDRPVANTVVFTAATLAPGASASFTNLYTVPADACAVTTTFRGTGQDMCTAAPVTNTVATTCAVITAPGIAITAVCPATPVVPGGALVYSGTVRNTGNISLTNVVVISDRPAPNTVVFTAATLAPGASNNFTGTYPVPTNACAVTTTFRGTGQDLCATTTVTNAVTTTCTVITAPGLVVTLTCPAVSVVPGGTITYTGTLRNTGNVRLNNVFVVNNQPAPNTPVSVPLTLEAGAMVPFTTSFTAPLDACSVSSTVTARGSDDCTMMAITNSASATCTLLTTPNLVITQVCPESPAVPGGMLIYSGTVRNAGDITLTNVVIVNSLSGATPHLHPRHPGPRRDHQLHRQLSGAN